MKLNIYRIQVMAAEYYYAALDAYSAEQAFRRDANLPDLSPLSQINDVEIREVGRLELNIGMLEDLLRKMPLHTEEDSKKPFAIEVPSLEEMNSLRVGLLRLSRR